MLHCSLISCWLLVKVYQPATCDRKAWQGTHGTVGSDKRDCVSLFTIYSLTEAAVFESQWSGSECVNCDQIPIWFDIFEAAFYVGEMLLVPLIGSLENMALVNVKKEVMIMDIVL